MIFPKASIIVLVPKISYHYRNIRISSLENSLKIKTKLDAFLKGIYYLFNYYKKIIIINLWIIFLKIGL